jgi:hypothetical protein
MTYTIENFDGASALDLVQQLQARRGTGVTSGCSASLNSTDQAIRIDVASGTAYVTETQVSVSGGSIDLPDGDSQHPRKDVVYIKADGTLGSVQGVPRQPKDGTGIPGTDREVYQPEPPDMSSLAGGFADGAPVAEIWVPAGATGASDMADANVLYVRDRRLEPQVSAAGTVSENDLAFDTATQSELDSHAADADAHHTAYTDDDAAAVVGSMAANGDGVTTDPGNTALGLNVVASGTVTLSSGSATIDTGVATSTTATFSVYLGPASDDADVAADIRADSGSGTFQIDIQETDTSVGNPGVAYDIVRLR